MTVRAFVLAVLLVTVGGATLAGGPPRIEVPQVDWYQLVPYLKVNISVTYRDGHTEFGGFSSSNRALFPDGYDQALDELAKVVVFESLRDRHVIDAVSEATEALEGAAHPEGLSPLQNNARYWERLVSGGEYLYRMKRVFERAKAAGTMQCYECSHGFKFEALRVIQ
jgi:hypothetical protein